MASVTAMYSVLVVYNATMDYNVDLQLTSALASVKM